MTSRRLSWTLFIFSLVVSLQPASAQKNGMIWLTNSDRSVLFQQQKQGLVFDKVTGQQPLITVDEDQRYQSIDGFGFALTGGSAMHIVRMDPQSRAALLKELFATDGNNIGISYLRLSIGASDLNEKIFSYDDLPEGETDPQMNRFNLGPDTVDVIPVMKEILQIAPSIKILGSPWSPPTWMKTNHDTRGGELKPDCYDAYAKYFVRYITEMKKLGITIDAVTVQNEPLHPGNNPSLLLPAAAEAAFIKKHLGPAFKTAGLKTKIIIYDHNPDRPEYALSVLNDPEAKQWVDGSAFHDYGGSLDTLTSVHNAHPDKNLYFTEQMVVQDNGNPTLRIASPVRRLIVGATRNWCRNVLEWNLAADPQNKPYTDRGGCSMCQGAVTIDGSQVSRNLAYYAMAHASKFVRPGSVRIASSAASMLPNVAFKTPDGKKVLVVVNDSDTPQTFAIGWKGRQAEVQLGNKSVVTCVWE